MHKLKNTIAIVFDDHQLFVDAFASFIEKMKIYHSVYTFSDEQELTHFLIKNNNAPIHLFIDYYLKDSTSLMMMNDAKRVVKKIKIIYISSNLNAVEIQHTLSYKVDGFISKNSDISTVLECIKKLNLNQQYLCPVIKKILSENEKCTDIGFTAREIEMLHYFNRGMSIAETADKTNLSKHTIVAHRRNMMQKTNSKSITELLAYARKNKHIL